MKTDNDEKSINRRDMSLYLTLGMLGGAALVKSSEAKADLIPDIWDIIAEFIMPIVEAAYGEIYSPIVNGIKEYTDIITDLYDPKESAEQIKIATSIAKKADALLTARTFSYNQMILDATRQLHTACADPVIAEQSKKIDSTIKEAVAETVNSKIKPILSTDEYAQAVKVRAKFIDGAFSIDGLKSPEFNASSLLTPIGYKTDESKGEALRFIENLIGTDYRFVDYKSKIGNLEKTTQVNVAAEISKAMFEKNTIAAELYNIYYRRVRTKGLLNKVAGSLSEQEYELLKPFVTAAGLSQYDLQNFEVSRFSSGLVRFQKLLGDSLEPNDDNASSTQNSRPPGPSVTSILKETAKAMALRDVMMEKIKQQESAISKLISLELKNEISRTQ